MSMCFPALPPQQQNEIRLRAPRSGEVRLEWDQNIDVNELLNRKYRKTQELGYASLVGEVAKIIENKIFLQNNPSFIFGGLTFSRNRKDIVVSLGSNSSYASIIEKMQSNGAATKETAEQILKNLSKGYIEANESGEFNLDVLSNEIFEELDKNAKKLMAVLICETIRFNDDGASARMAMRLVINNFENGSTSPFEDVFVESSGETPLSIFAVTGGKQRMLDQIIGEKSGCNSFFEKDKAILEGNKNFISEDEDENIISSVFLLNTSYPSAHPMQTRNNGQHFQGFYEDPPSSTVPSPARRQINAVRTFGNHDAIDHQNLALEEISEKDFPVKGQNFPRAYFCKNCKLFYSSFENQSECPLCKNEVKEIPRANLSRFIDSIVTWSSAELPSPLEGKIVELSE